MSDYVVSARKYRPDSFESLIGQDNIARTLKNSIQRGQLAHAYLASTSWMRRPTTVWTISRR